MTDQTNKPGDDWTIKCQEKGCKTSAKVVNYAHGMAEGHRHLRESGHTGVLLTRTTAYRLSRESGISRAG